MFSTRPIYRVALFSASLITMSHALAADHLVNTQYGEIKVKDHVERVVTLYEGALDASYALGVSPVGAVATRGSEGVSAYLGEQTKGIHIVGTARELNLEAIAAQKPDVILASSRLAKDKYVILSKIAPTIVPKSKPHTFSSWEDETRLFAQALNKSEQAEDVIERVHEREAALKKQVEAKIPAAQRHATVMRWMPQGALVMSPKIFASEVLQNTGFTVNDGGIVKEGRPHSSVLSLEKLPNIDTEWLFMATLNTEGEKSLAAAKNSPAFARLNVVKKDHVLPVDGQVWSSGSGPIAAGVILDDVQKLLDTKVTSSK